MSSFRNPLRYRSALPGKRSEAPEHSLLHSLLTGEGATTKGAAGEGTDTEVFTGIRGVDENGEAIAEGDTLYSKAISLVCIPGPANAFTFFEPMGDGFYTLPVTVEFNKEEGRFSVSGEQDHDWSFYLKRETEPSRVSGADGWEYDAEGQWLVMKKEGTGFRIRIH